MRRVKVLFFSGCNLDENAAKFAEKWGNAVPEWRRVALRPFPAGQPIRGEKEVCPQMTQMKTSEVRWRDYMATNSEQLDITPRIIHLRSLLPLPIRAHLRCLRTTRFDLIPVRRKTAPAFHSQ